MEPGRAGEKNEVTAKREKNIPPLGKTRLLILGEGKQALKGERRRFCWRGWGDQSTCGGTRWKSAGESGGRRSHPAKEHWVLVRANEVQGTPQNLSLFVVLPQLFFTFAFDESFFMNKNRA